MLIMGVIPRLQPLTICKFNRMVLLCSTMTVPPDLPSITLVELQLRNVVGRQGLSYVNLNNCRTTARLEPARLQRSKKVLLFLWAN